MASGAPDGTTKRTDSNGHTPTGSPSLGPQSGQSSTPAGSLPLPKHGHADVKGVLSCRLVDYFSVIGIPSATVSTALAELRANSGSGRGSGDAPLGHCCLDMDGDGLAAPAEPALVSNFSSSDVLPMVVGTPTSAAERRYTCLEVLHRFPAADHTDLSFPLRLEWFCFPGQLDRVEIRAVEELSCNADAADDSDGPHYRDDDDDGGGDGGERR